MIWVLHAHWQPPRQPGDVGGILFWAESSDAQSKFRHVRGRPLRSRDHPFCLSPETIRETIGSGTPLEDARAERALLRLPSAHSSPQPSPQLNAEWDPGRMPLRLQPWAIKGLWLPARKAFSVLVNLPPENRDAGYVLGAEAHYWRSISNLVLETLAEQKVLPTLVTVDAAHNLYHSRWEPVLDGLRDGPRLAQLAAAMPAVCRAEVPPKTENQQAPAPRPLLDSFMYAMCDALARAWGNTRSQKLLASGETPLERWLASLFTEDPTVTKTSAQQMRVLASGLQAWMRNLRAAGDDNFRIAFRLRAPAAAADEPGGEDWQLQYLLQARDDPSLFIAAEEVWRQRGNLLAVLGRRFEQPQERMLAGLGYAARLYPALRDSLKDRAPTGLTLDTPGAYSFLRDSAPLLEQAGFGLHVPPWWNQRGARLGVRLHIAPKKGTAGLASGKLNLNTLVAYEWQLSLGDTQLSREEFEALAALKMPLVQVRGQWVQLDVEQVEAAIRFWETQRQKGEMGLLDVARLALDEESSVDGLPLDEVVAEGWVNEWLEKLSEQDRFGELPQPGGLNGELRPYQRYGFSWLAFFRRWGLGACLADDMGLGKTIQALALLLYEKESLGKLPGPTLLVCPTSVVTNWQREARRFAPGLNLLIHQGSTRLRNSAFTEAARSADLVLTSYPLLRLDAELLQSVTWYGTILDEAQNIKNPAAKQTQAARKLQSTFRFALTGTPVENRLSELWSLMHFLNPGYLGTQANFRRDFSVPIERFGDPDATERLRKMIAPFILRRLKSDPRVIQDLPEKTEMKEYCTLSEEQATLYEAVVKTTMEKIEQSDGIERRGQVLALLMHLKQVCNHPAHFLHETEGASLNNGRSGKLTRLVEMMDELLEAGSRALIFTQFAEMGHLLAEYLPQVLNHPVFYLHGGTPSHQRDVMVRRFQDEENAPPIFILSLKAGGLGLNLTRASYVFHFDRWWNPAVEDQATDRAFRIGQHNNVMVHKFVTLGTLEEKIDDLIESKKGLAQAIIGGGEEWITELSTDELRDLVSLRRT